MLDIIFIPNTYSYWIPLTNGYQINPMKMRSLWQGKFGVCRSKGFKVAGCQTLRMILPQAGSNPGQMRLHTLRLEWPKQQTFCWELQFWKLVTLQPFDLQTQNFQHCKIFTFFSKFIKFQDPSSILRVSFAWSKRHPSAKMLITLWWYD